jgi:tetrahydromethanopterin S-methyltransferase subunit F
MKSVEKYIDELKEKLGSDYQTAHKMGVDRSVIANIRKRGAISDENAVKVANLLGIDPGEVLIAAAMARSEGDVKEAWRNVSKRAGIAAGVLLAVMMSMAYPNQANAAENAFTAVDNIHYAKPHIGCGWGCFYPGLGVSGTVGVASGYLNAPCST